MKYGVFDSGKDETDVGGVGCLCETRLPEVVSHFLQQSGPVEAGLSHRPIFF